MTEQPYAIVLSRPVLEPTVCQGKGCGQPIETGGLVHLVYHEWRFLRDPGSMDSRAYLCDRCVGRLGARARRSGLPSKRQASPFLYRGKPVASF